MHKYTMKYYKTRVNPMKMIYQKELDKIKKIIKGNPRGTTLKEISEKINVNRNVVAKYLDVLQMAGEVDVEKYGRSKVYYPSKSVPISTIFDFSNDFIIVVRKDMTTVEINSPFIKYLGLMKKDKIVGKNITDLSLVKAHTKIKEHIVESLEKQEVLEEEIKYKVKDHSTPDHLHAKYIPTTLKDGEKGVAVIFSKK